MQTGQQHNRNANQKRQEYRNSAQPRQRGFMQVAILNWWRCPAAAHCEIAHTPGKDERQQQRYSESDQIEQGQPNPRILGAAKSLTASPKQSACSSTTAQFKFSRSRMGGENY